MNAIYKFVLGLIGKRSGVVTTLPNQKQIEFQANILAEKFMQNGIDPNALKSPEQVKNVLANIDQANMRVIPADSAEGASISRGLGIAKKADVMDMEGNKIPDGSQIMGGKQIQPIDMTVKERTGGMLKGKYESDEAIKTRLVADNKKGIKSIKINLVDDSIAKIKSMEPMDAMKEANLVAGKKGKYANLDDNQVKKIMDDTEDHIFERDIPEDPEDFAIGGRVGLKGGSGFLKFLKKFKVKQSGDDVKEFLSKRQFMKDIVGNTEKAKKARELREIKKNVDNYMKQYKGYQFPSDEQIKIDLEKKIQPILNKGRKLNADGGRIGYKFGLGPLFNFLNKKSPAKAYTDYLKSVKDRVKAGKEAEVAGEVIPIAAGGALITNQLKKKLKAMNEEQKKKIKQEMEKKADGGRIGYFKGAVAGGENISPGTDVGGNVRNDNPFTGGGGGNNNPPPVVNPVSNNEPAVNPIFRKTLREPELQLDAFIKKMALENAMKEEEDDVNYPTSGIFLDPKLDKKKQADIFSEFKANGGRIGYKAGSVDKMRRLFLKTIGAGAGTIGAAKSGIFSGFNKSAGKEVAKEVAQQTTTSTPPPYFFKLAEKIKMMGDDATATTDRTIAKTLKSKDGKSEYLLEEDLATGDTSIKKIYKEDDNMITDVEIMELRKGEVVMGKDGRPVKVPDEYEEVTEVNKRIYKDDYNASDYTDGINVDEIIKEVDDKVPSIKYASGGLAYMLGE